MANTLTAVDFHGQTLLVTLIDGQPAVALRPVCDALGLDWQAQLQRIKRHPVLKSTVVVITTVAQDGKQRETTCLPLDKLNGWLFGISAARVKPELRERLIQYQRECFDVLARHFGVAQTQPAAITDAQALQSQPAWPASRQRVLTVIENNHIVSMQIVPDNASVLPAAQWAKAIESGDVYLTPEELAQLHSVVSQQINHSYLRMHRQRKPPSAPPAVA